MAFCRKNSEVSSVILDRVFIGYIVFLSIAYSIISGRRVFNFDEFQVMYASAGIIRKGTLYADEIGIHFPLANLLMSIPCRLVGFDAAVLVIARYVIFVLNGIMLFYAYRIGSLLWNRRAGLLAVCMILSSYVFFAKGVEIRHDVFNTLFNIMGAYYGITYLKRRGNCDLVVSALCFGMAAASTQKAFVMIAGFLFGLVIHLIIQRDYKTIGKMSFGYLLFGPIPLAGILMILVSLGNESADAFLQEAFINAVAKFAPFTEELYPFPYNRLELFGILLRNNPLFYVLGIGAIVSILLSAHERRSRSVIIAIWAAVGLAFYVTAKRPFFQTLLPVIPPLAIIGGWWFSGIWRCLEKWPPIPKTLSGVLLFFFLLVFPLQGFSAAMRLDMRFARMLTNIAFCAENLGEDDKVLCFTQNQIFFDPVLKLREEECGQVFYDYDADCFERKMTQSQCKVIINDDRTKMLSQEIKRRIAENYTRAKAGDILIPGFEIPPGEVISKKVWIEGSYYSPIHSLDIDGERIGEKMVYLGKGMHTFQNQTDRRVTLVYVFDPASLKRHLESF